MSLDPAVQVAAITGGVTLIGAVIGIGAEMLRRQGKALSSVTADASAAREQVQNSHGTNLRDDVDRVLAALDQLLTGQDHHADALRGHGRDIGAIRRELAHEREERHAADLRIERDLGRQRLG